MRTIGRSDAADDCPDCCAYRSADRRTERGTSNGSTGCSNTSAYWMRAWFTRDRVGIFPRFFLHSVGRSIALIGSRIGGPADVKEHSNLTPKVRQSDGLVPWRAFAT